MSNGTAQCIICSRWIDADVHAEELGMCVECSNEYFSYLEHEAEVQNGKVIYW